MSKSVRESTVRGHKGSLYDRCINTVQNVLFSSVLMKKITVFALVRSLELEPIPAAQGTEIGVQSVIES
jgi:hypothetical protein